MLELLSLKKGYQVDSLIGKGATGEIYLVSDTEAENKKMAVKVLSTLKVKESNIHREINMLTKMHHPQICQYLKTVIIDENYYLIQEYYPGPDLLSWKRKHRNDPNYQNRVLNLSKQLLKGVDYLATNNFVHLDIKFENIIVSEEDKVTLIDFGMCRMAGQKIKLQGTPNYLPPEMIRAFIDKEPIIASFKFDIWSLGLTIYGLVNNSKIWPSSDKKVKFKEALLKLFDYILSKQHKFTIPALLYPILSKMLRYNPEKRFFAHELLKIDI